MDDSTTQRIFVVGNSGSGKSTLAKRLAAEPGHVHVDLDPFAWEPGRPVRRAVPEPIADVRRMIDGRGAVVEGMYADLVEGLLRPRDRLVWLDLDVETCLDHCRERAFEPHKWGSAEEQDAFLPQLLEFVATYADREDVLGRRAHQARFDAHAGPKQRVTSPDEVAALCVRSDALTPR